MVALQRSGELALRVSASMIILTTLAVTLRIFVRTKVIWVFASEDALILLALFLFYVDQGLFLSCQPQGLSSSNCL